MIARNTFRDFAYGAIGIGEHYGDNKVFVSGVVENNEMYYTESYFSNYKKHTLMDSGVIYFWTQNDSAIIRGNYIHDYIGMKDNRGVFCDDGASNLTITDNIIMNIANCYSIESRLVKDHRKDFHNNENNLIENNIVNNGILFMGYRENERHCKKGVNYYLAHENALISCFSDLEVCEKDVEVDRKFVKSKLTLLKEKQTRSFY